MNNRGGLVLIVIIIIGTGVMFTIPLLAMSEKNYDAAQEAISAANEKLKDKVIRTKEFTEQDYQNYLDEIQAQGITPDVQIEISTLNANAAQKVSKADGTVQSSDNYTTQYTTNIMDEFKNNNGKITLNTGDKFYVEVQSTNRTWKEIMSGRKATIIASSSGVVGE